MVPSYKMEGGKLFVVNGIIFVQCATLPAKVKTLAQALEWHDRFAR